MSTLKKLILESEDEFNVTPDESWNYIYLKIGDEITPDMWNETSDAIWDLMDLDLDKTYKIKKFSEGIYNIIFVTLTDKTNKETHESLSSISNALKSPYQIALPNDLVESEDEFDVTPNKEWNVTYLRAGDTITSDMWNDNSKRSPMYILGFEWDQSREEVLVVLEVLYTDYPIQYWDIDFVNKRLKPEFQITDNSNLMENEDEFNVTPGEQWNQIELTMGDTITPDMWKDKTNISIADVPVQIVGWGNEDEDEDEDEPGTYVYVMLNTPDGYTYDIDLDILNDVLKPKFRVTIDKDLRENEDEFNVTPDESWNTTYLQVGDKVTYDMLKDGSDAKKVMDKYLGKDAYIELIDFKNGMYTVRQYNSKDDSFSTPYRVVPEWFNKDTLNPQYQLDVPLGNRVDMFSEGEEDEFNVDASEDWNVIELEIGDKITPDMWKDVEFNEFRKRETWTIYDIYYNEGFGWTVELTSNENGFDNLITLLSLNKDLKPQFQVVNSEVLDENEDEFNVTPGKQWNADYVELGEGDIITPDMWNPEEIKNGNIYDLIDDPTEPWYIDQISNQDSIWMTTDTGGEVATHLQYVNDMLLPGYRVGEFINESEDEFNVTPDEKTWNPREFKVGDTFITIENQHTPYKIVFIGKAGKTRERFDYHGYTNDVDIVLFGLANGRPFYADEKYLAFPIDHFNNKYSELNGAYVPKPMNEQEDEFNVDAPKEWNVIELDINDIITPKMFNKKADVDWWMSYAKKLKILKFIKEYDNWTVVLSLPNQNQRYVSWDIKSANEDLKPQFQIINPDYLKENEDEFNINAPKEWNVKDLGINSYLDSTNMNGGSSNTRYKIVGFKKDPNDRELVGLIKQVKNEGTRMWYDLSKNPSHWYVDFLNRKLKPGFEVVYGYIAPKQLDESDDEFNVTPSVLWNLDLDTPINITITKEFEVTDWNTDTSAISIETTLIKTSVAELQEESGENYNYDEITVKNIINWINENSEVVIALFDMGGEEKKSWHDVDRGFKPSSNNLDYDLVDMELRVEIPESNLNESDEDFNVTPNETWNTIEVGDIIEPYMWLDPKKTSRYLLVGNYGAALKLKRILSKEDETLNPGDEDRLWSYNNPNVIQVMTDFFNNELKPQYRFTGHLNESDEDFNITPSEDWAVQELGVGDTLDPTNLKMQDWSKKYIIKKIAKFAYWNDVFLDLYKYNSKLKDWEFVKTFSNEISNVNDILKPGFKIQAP